MLFVCTAHLPKLVSSISETNKFYNDKKKITEILSNCNILIRLWADISKIFVNKPN